MHEEEKYIRDLIAQGEHQQLDFKFEITSAQKIARTLVAFANTDGGRLLIGVKDNGRISGIRSEEEYYMIDAAASMYCKPEITFKAIQHLVEGRTVLEVYVPPSAGKPHYAPDEEGKWKAYHRVRDENFLVHPIMLEVWKRSKRERGTFIRYTEKEQQLLRFLKLSGPSSFPSLKRELGMKSGVLKAILVNLVSLKAVSMEYAEKEMVFSSGVESRDIFPGDRDQ